MQFPDLVILELIRGRQFGNLLVEKGDIGLILIVDSLFLVCELVQSLSQGPYLVVV